MKKALKILSILGIFGIIVGGAGYWGLRLYVMTQANEEAQRIIETTLADLPEHYSPDQEVMAFTQKVYHSFVHDDPSNSFLLRLRPYLTHRILPEFLRLPNGALEVVLNRGFCDNAARKLDFILAQRGYTSVQWNMVTPSLAHSALLVHLPDNRPVYVDPFFGYMAFDNENQKLLSLEEAQSLMQTGYTLDNVMKRIGDPNGFYKQLPGMLMAAQGDDLIIPATLPETTGPLYFGQLDGQENDVSSAAKQKNMTPYWHYMGHRYSREWVRILTATQKLRLEITLVDDVEESVITALPRPEVDGRKMTWTLNPGEEIKFVDGDSQISWRRLNSYINIDQIAIYPI